MAHTCDISMLSSFVNFSSDEAGDVSTSLGVSSFSVGVFTSALGLGGILVSICG